MSNGVPYRGDARPKIEQDNLRGASGAGVVRAGTLRSPEGRRELVQMNEEWEVVRRIFRLHLEMESYRGAAAE